MVTTFENLQPGYGLFASLIEVHVQLHTKVILETFVTRFGKTRHFPDFGKIELTPEMVTATFHLAVEQISKRSVIQLPRYSSKRARNTQNCFPCKCNF